MKSVLLGALVLGAAGLIGCEAEVEPARPVVVDRPAVVEPGVDVYYERGYYDGPYWVYTDREGHRFREERAEHERREARVHAGREHEERHEEHHEEHH